MSNGSAYLLFVDGKQEIATAVTNSNDGLWLSGPINRDNVTIGARQRGGVIADSFLAGNVDDVRFYNRALSANEINQLYQNSQQGYPNLINRTTKRIWNGSVNIVNYPNGPNTSQPIIRNNLKQNQLVNRRSSLNNGLLAWWLCVPGRMGAGKWFDLLNTFHGKFGDPALVFKPNTRQGGFGSVQFDATVLHDVLIGGNMAKLSPANNTNGNITAMAWFNSSAIGAGQCIFAMASAGGTARLDLGLGQSGGGFNKLSAVLRDGSGNSTVPQSQTIINPNTWYHVALIKRGTSGELYINGVFNASNSNASMGAIDTTSGNIRIGAFAFNEASTFSGRIDDVRIYGRDLVPKEIQQVYLDSLSGYQKTLGKISTRLNTYANSGFISPPINLGIKGIDVKQTSKQLVIRTLLVDLNGNQVTSGNTLMSIYEVQSDGSIKTFDFNNNAFTTGSVVKSQANMVHRTTNNRTFNTGIWTYSLAQLQGFNVGSVYISQITNTNAFPAVQAKEFQYGDAQGDDGAFVKFIITPGSTNLTIKTNRSEATSFWNNSLIAFSTGSLRGISARVLSYTSGSFTLKTSLPSTPSIGDSGVIIGSQ
jgi:hypothetical protein